MQGSAQSWAQVLRDGQQLLLFQNHLSGLQGSKLAAMLGTECTGEQSRHLGVPADICPGQPGTEAAASETQPKGESRGMAPVGTRRWDREGALPFLEAGEDPTVLAPGQAPSNLSISRHKSHIGYRARARGLDLLGAAPIPYGDVNLGLSRSPAPPGFPSSQPGPWGTSFAFVVGV